MTDHDNNEVAGMDEQIVMSLTDSVINNEFVQVSLDTYARRLHGYGLEDDMSDNEAYWETYTRKLQYYVTLMVPRLRKEETFEEIVF